MKKYILFLFTLLTLCGCAKAESAPKTAVCFVVASTANSQGLNVSSPQVQQAALDAVSGFGYVSVVNLDGQPETVMANSFDIPEQYKKASKTRLQQDAQANANAILSGLQTLTADDPEADYLEALHQAVRSLSAQTECDRKTVVVLGTGLSTAGELDFRNNLLSAEPETVAALLKERNAIPNFSGITVLWQQMGDTAAPQQALTHQQRQRLADIWTAIVEAGGGTISFSDFPAAPVPTADLPPVSPVELTAQPPIRFENAETSDLLGSPLVLTEEQVTFVGDEAVYLHPDKAAELLKPIADYLLQNPAVKILLIGTTAGDSTTEYTSRLSRERAETVRSTLISLGVAENRITAIGMASSDPWHIPGVGTEGSLAAANRKVVILDADSDTAKDILH